MKNFEKFLVIASMATAIILISVLAGVFYYSSGKVPIIAKQDSTFFPTQNEPARSQMQALLSDKELIIKDGCLRAGGYLLVWPYGFSLSADKNGTLHVINSTGQPVMSVGDKIKIGGGADETPDGRVAKGYSAQLPNERCPGPYWIVEEVITVEKNMPGNFPITVKQSGGAALMIKECGDKNYINGTADYIIEGGVESVESKWNEDKNSIFTYTSLSIKKYVKGIPFKIASTNLQIITPGGTVGGITQAVEDQPIFHKGKAVRIYFKNYSGEFSIVCGSLGVEDLYW